jgi:hypothetical protein
MAMPQGRLDPFLAAWKQEWRMATQSVRRLYFQALRPTRTDSEGRFEIRGAGAERVAVLQFKGPGIAQSNVYLLTRSGFDPAAYNKAVLERIPMELRLPGQPPLLHGPTFDYVAAPTRVIEGTVREAGSGKPLPGVTVWAGAGYNNSLNTVSDGQGRYRLVGLPKMKEYLLHTEPGRNDPWLRQGARVRDTEGLEPLRVDFEVARGVVLAGRVIDRATGKGVRGGLRFAPLPDNKYFGKKGYDAYRYERLMNPTDAEGRFRLAIIPGSGVLMAQAFGGEKTADGLSVNPYKQATFDAADRKRVHVVEDGNYFTTADNSIASLGTECACKVLDLAPDAGTVSCDLFLERGQTLRVNVQDPDGKPLAGATVAGMTASWPITFPLTGSSCTVYALGPEKPRLVLFFHPARRLAGQLTVRGDEKEPPTVRLAATGSVTARVLDADGQPIAGAEVRVAFPREPAQELYRHLNRQKEPVRTDEKGSFRLEGMVADLPFNLQIFKGPTFLVGTPRIGLRRVGSGQTLDLGDVRTRPGQ